MYRLTCAAVFFRSIKSNEKLFMTPAIESAAALGRRFGVRSTLIVCPHNTPGGRIVAIAVRSSVDRAISRHAAR